jgi:integrase/recombinase XerD
MGASNDRRCSKARAKLCDGCAPIGKYLERFRKDCELRGMSHASTLSYLSAVRMFAAYLRGTGVSIPDVDKQVLRNYVGHIQARKLSFKTLTYDFAALSAFYEMLVFEGDIRGNPVTGVRKRYLRRYKNGNGLFREGRKLISVEEMATLVKSTKSARERAVLIMLAKTGVRRGELVRMDLDDLDMEGCSVTLKPTAKRTNRLLFFDEEAKGCLAEWLKEREKLAKPESEALFLSNRGLRLDRNRIHGIVVMHATVVGLHDPDSERLEDHFTPHCCRHWFTTHLMRSGMPREHVQELRGDVRGNAIDIYYHIDPEELRRSYLAHIPKLGI